MPDVPDVLGGMLLPPEKAAETLVQIGKTTDARLPGFCKICVQPVELGSKIARCQKYGWCHLSCLLEEQEKAAREGS